MEATKTSRSISEQEALEIQRSLKKQASEKVGSGYVPEPCDEQISINQQMVPCKEDA